MPPRRWSSSSPRLMLAPPTRSAAWSRADVRSAPRDDAANPGGGSNMLAWLSRAVLLALAVAAAPAAAQAQAADTVLLNGKIVTVDDRFTIAQALAIRGGRIVKVGATSDTEGLRGPQTRIIDL